MQPYLPADNYNYTLPQNNVNTDIGEKGIISFRSFDDQIISGDISVILNYRDLNSANISANALLDLQLSRICGDPLAIMYGKWSTAGLNYLGGKHAASWTRGELSLYQKNRSIWENIDSAKDTKEDDLFFSSFHNHSFEYLFRWLVANSFNSQWRKVWLRAFRLSPFDERMQSIAEEWLRQQISEGAPLSHTKLILFSFLEYNSQLRTDDKDFSEVLSDYISENIDEIYEILTPISFPYLLFKNIDLVQHEKLFNNIYNYFKERIGDDIRYRDTMSVIDKLWEDNKD